MPLAPALLCEVQIQDSEGKPLEAVAIDFARRLAGELKARISIDGTNGFMDYSDVKFWVAYRENPTEFVGNNMKNALVIQWSNSDPKPELQMMSEIASRLLKIRETVEKMDHEYICTSYGTVRKT